MPNCHIERFLHIILWKYKKKLNINIWGKDEKIRIAHRKGRERIKLDLVKKKKGKIQMKNNNNIGVRRREISEHIELRIFVS